MSRKKYGKGKSSSLSQFLSMLPDDARDAAVEIYLERRRLGQSPVMAYQAPGVCSIRGLCLSTAYSYIYRRWNEEEPYFSHLAMLEKAELEFLRESKPNLDKIAEENPLAWRRLVHPSQFIGAEQTIKAGALKAIINEEVLPGLAKGMQEAATELVPSFLVELDACRNEDGTVNDEERAQRLGSFVYEVLDVALGGGGEC